MNWETLRKNVYYLDGSLRDIFAFNVTRKEWEIWIDLINDKYTVHFYNGKTEQIQNKIDKNIVFESWDGKADFLINATIKLDTILIKCYFFNDMEIENDVTPSEINSIEDHNKLVEYLIDFSDAIKRKVVLTPENYGNDDVELIVVEKRNFKIIG